MTRGRKPFSDSELFVREADHRIKNHLQLLASYALLASRQRGLTASELAHDISAKLGAIAGAHDALYQADGHGAAPAEKFLRTLLAAIPAEPHAVEIDCAAALQLPAPELAPLGMIVSEAVSNALKHAFPDGRGHVRVSLSERAGRIDLRIDDDGVGIASRGATRASGTALIDMLARQLGGEALVGPGLSGGSRVWVSYTRGAVAGLPWAE